jgi:predicted aspartyl protease
MLAMLVGVGCGRPLPPELPGRVDTQLAISPRGTVLVPVVLHDRTGAAQHYELVVDTGASITAITPATAAALGISGVDDLVLNEGRDAVPARRATLPRLVVGGVTFRNLRIAIVDMPAARQIDARFGGILGLDALARHDVVIDLVRRRFTLHPAGYAARSDAVREMQRLRFQRGRYGLIALPVRVEGFPEMLGVLDLGAQWSVMNRAAARMLSDFTPNSVLTPLQPRRYARLELAGVVLDHHGFQIEDLGVFQRLRIDRRPAILLGADLFQGRSLVLAYQDRAVYVSR